MAFHFVALASVSCLGWAAALDVNRKVQAELRGVAVSSVGEADTVDLPTDASGYGYEYAYDYEGASDHDESLGAEAEADVKNGDAADGYDYAYAADGYDFEYAYDYEGASDHDESLGAEADTPSGGNGSAPTGSGGNGSAPTGLKKGIKSTVYWDCNGQACDSYAIKNFPDPTYVAHPKYAPQDPMKHGGPAMGEKLWLTGAASDALSKLMGPDDPCCGKDGGRGGCGKCVYLKVPSAGNPDFAAIGMKKNRCPPSSNGCDKPHFDLAIPGMDNLKYSLANICGKAGTGFKDKQQSAAFMDKPKGDASLCSKLPSEFQEGCKLFTQWNWTVGDPQTEWKVVDCPPAMVKHYR